MSDLITTSTKNPGGRPRSPLAAVIESQLARKREFFGDPLLSLRECATSLGISTGTMHRLIAARRLRTWRNGPHGHHKIKSSELRRFLAEGFTHPGGEQ
jgi:excisionase family DNA binding protein